MKNFELLAPAGNFEKLKTALYYGADAVYVGGVDFSLRALSENFNREQLAEAVEYTHVRGKKIYVAVNILAKNADFAHLEDYLKYLHHIKVDAVIVSDPGVIMLIKEKVPGLEVHLSTQASTTNKYTAAFWVKQGVSRIVLARELSLNEVKEISDYCGGEIEVFVHGAMCISYSGRCLLSNYMTGRDSNLGACAHPCRWKYYLMEEKREGEYFPVVENDRGTFIFNSKDLNMIRFVPELIKAGVSSFKIEGRVKTEYYVATVTKAYRDAIDRYFDGLPFDEKIADELTKVSHREYTTGFFFGKPDSNQQIYGSSSYKREYDLVGVVDKYNADEKLLEVTQRNKFFVGDEIELLIPGEEFKTIKIEKMFNENMESIENCPHAMMKLYIPCEYECPMGTILRKAR